MGCAWCCDLHTWFARYPVWPPRQMTFWIIHARGVSSRCDVCLPDQLWPCPYSLPGCGQGEDFHTVDTYPESRSSQCTPDLPSGLAFAGDLALDQPLCTGTKALH